MGVVFGVIFLVWCFQAENDWARVGVILYLFGMLGSYLASTLYHSMKHHSKWKERLRKWDHAAIYWHIAGSYSPLTLIALREQGYWGWSLFCFVWACAIAGTIISFIKPRMKRAKGSSVQSRNSDIRRLSGNVRARIRQMIRLSQMKYLVRNFQKSRVLYKYFLPRRTLHLIH